MALFLAQQAIRQQLIREQIAREFEEERREWIRQMNKSFERWFEEVQAMSLTNLSLSFWTTYLWLGALPHQLPPAPGPQSQPLPP